MRVVRRTRVFRGTHKNLFQDARVIVTVVLGANTERSRSISGIRFLLRATLGGKRTDCISFSLSLLLLLLPFSIMTVVPSRVYKLSPRDHSIAWRANTRFQKPRRDPPRAGKRGSDVSTTSPRTARRRVSRGYALI